MNFDAISVSYDPLINTEINEPNRSYRKQRNILVIIAIVLGIFLLAAISILIFIAVKKTPSSKSTTFTNDISTTTTAYTVSNASLTSTSTYCIPVGWNPVGDIVARGNYYIGFTVDDDFNTYAVSAVNKSLEKWSPRSELINKFFDGQFEIYSPLFFHSSSQSIYFCYTWKGKRGIYKLINANMTLVTVMDQMMSQSGIISVEYTFNALFVDSLGNIFVLDSGSRNVFKWTPGSTYFMLVANSQQFDFTSDGLSSPQGLAIDEINNRIYLLDIFYTRVLKYMNGSQTGMTIIDGSPRAMFSDNQSEHITPKSILVDTTGNIVMGEEDKISIWTPDGKFHKTVLETYQTSEDNTKYKLSPWTITLDRAGNLYVWEKGKPGVIRFNRTLVTCTNHIS